MGHIGQHCGLRAGQPCSNRYVTEDAVTMIYNPGFILYNIVSNFHQKLFFVDFSLTALLDIEAL